jgi:hypothetical protein
LHGAKRLRWYEHFDPVEGNTVMQNLWSSGSRALELH